MWSPLLQRGLGLLDGRVHEVRTLAQELTHFALRTRRGVVLWCDGDHGFNPYDFAELNLTRGLAADQDAHRILVKRCMTPFQWDTVLTQHVEAMLDEREASLVLALPFDRLFSTDELQPWEQVDYVRYSLRSLRTLAMQRSVPILLGIDMLRWRMTHPQLLRLTSRAFDHRWALRRPRDGARSIADVVAGFGHQEGRQATLLAYATEVPEGAVAP